MRILVCGFISLLFSAVVFADFSVPTSIKILLKLTCQTDANSDRPLKLDVSLIDDGSIVTEWTIKDLQGNLLDKSMDYAGNLEIKNGKYLGWTGSEQSSDIDVQLSPSGIYQVSLTYWKESSGSDEIPEPYQLTCK